MDDWNISQRVKEAWLLFIIMGFIAAPAYAIALLIAWLFVPDKYRRWIPWAMAIGCVLSFLSIWITRTPWEYLVPETRMQWLIGPSQLRISFMFLCMGIASLADSGTADEKMLEQEAKRRSSKYIHTDKLPLDSRGHMAVLGTTGSGKTTALLHLVKDSIIKGEQLYIVSGKNGTNDERSLLNMTKRLAEKYGRPVYVVSVNPQEQDRRKYNPLEHMLPTELADAMLSMSEFTEPHYREATGMWIKTIGELLYRLDRPLSLGAVMEVYQFDAFSKLAREAQVQGTITKEQLREYLALKDIAEVASLSRSRYMNLLYGEGKDVLGIEDDAYINCYRAREAGAVFILDLDSFRYTDFTFALGRLCIHDLRNVIGSEFDVTTKKRIILDELGSYATEQLMPIFTQARSIGYQIVVATQSIADLDNVSETYSKRLLENCNQYLVLRLNESEDAERIANILGTETVVETTRKSEGDSLALGGEGTKKLVQEYKVSPDTIKELSPLCAVYYDKNHPEQVQMIHIPFVEINEK